MCPLQGPITSVVRNKLCCQGRNYRSGTFKTNWKVGLDCYEFLCFESPSVLFASLLPSNDGKAVDAKRKINWKVCTIRYTNKSQSSKSP